MGVLQIKVIMLWAVCWTLTSHVVIAADQRTDSGRTRRAVIPITTKKLRIVTLRTDPYVTNITTPQGFIPDLIYALSQKLNFSYEFYPSPDYKYGSQNPDDGSWDGMIGEVIKNKHEPDGNVSKDNDPKDTGADMAAAAITITKRRQRDVSFLHPFHNLGLTMVAKKPMLIDKGTESSVFDFGVLKPFSASVWGLITLIALLVAVLLFGLNHFNPYEWGGRYNIGQANIHQKEAFSISGSLWFVFSTLQWQGFERAPRSIASKILTCFWFAFVTLTLVTYIGSLINNLWWASMALRHNPMKHPITDLEDLVSGAGRDFKYGAVRGGSTMRYVQDAASYRAEFLAIKNYWETEDGKKQLVDGTADGIKKVRSEKYAFMMETMSARWLMNQEPCDLTTIGEQFAKRSYGFAVPKNWPYMDQFNHAILEMLEEGSLDQLEHAWWEGRGECWNQKQIEKSLEKAAIIYLNNAKPQAVGLDMFWGQLLLMVVGLVLTVMAGVAEIFYYRYKGRYQTNNRPQGHTLKLDNDDGDGNL